MNQIYPIDILDSSKLASFQKCPRKFLYDYILCWAPKNESHHLIFGGAFHNGLEVLNSSYPNIPGKEVIEKAHKAFDDEFQLRANFDNVEDWKQKTPENAHLALVEYADRYRADYKRYKPLLLERSGQVPINTNMDMLTVKIDGIYEDQMTGKIWIKEHKTAGAKPVDIYNTRLQIIGYYHALNMMYGVDKVGGVIADVIIFYQPNTAAAKKRIESGGYVNGFERFLVMKGLEQIEDGLATINYWVKAIKDAYSMLLETKDPQCFPKNSESCWSYGSVCPFYSFCSACTNPLETHMPYDYRIKEWNPLEVYEQMEIK